MRFYDVGMTYKKYKQYRYQGYDYSQNGFYFVTICTKNRESFFGEVTNGVVKYSEIGEVANKCWQDIPQHFPFVKLDRFIVMPNHIHGIIVIEKAQETQNIAGMQNFAFPQRYQNKFGPQSKNLSSIIRGFKVGVTKYVNNSHLSFAWQPRFYDRIIRNEDELYRIQNYIINNPSKWESDRNNPKNL